jgi:putative FmdB family regulatory protein
MPTYEYACSSCQHEWEFEQSIKDAALTECPACHQATAKRQISRGTGFILKGSGWYADLYSSSSNSKPSGDKPSSDKPSSDSGSGGAGGTSEGSGSTGSASGGGSDTPSGSPSPAKSSAAAA